MAELFTLAEELSCSICLESFKEPVTTPCGHNFCRACLDETWTVAGAPYLCPQCRTAFHTRPQLLKNTVLCAIVEQFLQAEVAQEALPDGWSPPARTQTPSVAGQVACDHCMTATAVKTCLVCMASFCQEHLKPHLDSPAFRDHPLQPPVCDLMRRKCPQHNRLREFFCSEHCECICHVCLVEHKTCSPVSLSQATAEMEAKMKQKLTVIYGQINGAAKALEDVRAKQQSVRDSAQKKVEKISQEHLEMKAVIDASEANLTRKIKEEEKRVTVKFESIYQILLKKKSEIQNLKEEIELALAKGDELEFLEKAAKLQGVTTKPVYIPKVELNHELIKVICQDASDLKNQLKQCSKQCQGKPKEPTGSGGPEEPRPTTPHKPSYLLKKAPKEEKKVKKPPTAAAAAAASPAASLSKVLPSIPVEFTAAMFKPVPGGATKSIPPPPNAVCLKAKVLEAFLAKSRAELLEYSTKVILDYNTCHNKVALSGNYTEASVADTPQNYRLHPQRFVSSSQVMGLHCYKKGIYYWEVELQKNSFCGVGICYGSMEREGPGSRLGRNSASWCVEWFNNKISAWHNNVEKTLPSTKTTRVGVLLNCDHGFVIFFGVADKIYLMYKFRADFTEAVYPAFWVFSAGTMLSICNSK